jgi:phosphatidylglycerophosphate synthase
LLVPQKRKPTWYRLVAVLVVAALTDLADGASSRPFQAASPAGRLLDPIADKVFVLIVVMTLVIEKSPGCEEASPYESAPCFVCAASRTLAASRGELAVAVENGYFLSGPNR